MLSGIMAKNALLAKNSHCVVAEGGDVSKCGQKCSIIPLPACVRSGIMAGLWCAVIAIAVL